MFLCSMAVGACIAYATATAMLLKMSVHSSPMDYELPPTLSNGLRTKIMMIR